MFKKILLSILLISPMWLTAGDADWPTVNPEMKPGARWWWLGSAVDSANLTFNLEAYAKAGLGSLEITPIYGVKGNDANNLDYLSPEWMQMLKHTIKETDRLGILTDMSTGTGWPFGGPEVSLQNAASKLFIRNWKVNGGDQFEELVQATERNQQTATLLRLMAYNGRKVMNLSSKVNSDGRISWKVPRGEWTLIAAFNGKTFQKVKRAAPGGDGYVIDHFSSKAVATYLNKFDEAFKSSGTPYPHNFFNDSYEVYGADWTEDFFEQFEQRRGYKLENYLPAFLSEERTDMTARLIADYRETISDLLLENFTQQWSNWARANGSKTRNQAHGSPGNLIDLYATVDVPECEGFGLTDFDIPGLRKDSLTRKNDSDLSMLKYSSSAAHISGKPLVGSETFTWLTEHFRTSLAQCKPDLDLMFVSGVNHMLFHGTPYSPKEAEWPGWLFYASINMSPTNSIWKDAPAMFDYITRSQSFLQMGQPDNDFLLYLPVYDVWHDQKGRFLQFDIHSMERRMPEFIHAVHAIYENGFDVDYISDSFILSTRVEYGQLITSGGVSYKALILPAVKRLPVKVMQHILELSKQGATVVFLETMPQDVPGFAKHTKNRKALQRMVKKTKVTQDFTQTQVKTYGNGRLITGSDYNQTLQSVGVQAEELMTVHGLHALRRSNPEGHHYFISALKKEVKDAWVTLAVKARSALYFDPMTGEIGKAQLRQVDGRTQVRLQLHRASSIILKTFSEKDIDHAAWAYVDQERVMPLVMSDWQLMFVDSEPAVSDTFTISRLQSWTELDHPTLKINSATGVYSTSFTLNAAEAEGNYWLDLGDVRESARVILNNQEVATLWAVPFRCRVGGYLKAGINTLRIEVTNLPANRIAEYDRQKISWRNFNEINMVNIRYKPSDYSDWETVESGLLGPVRLINYQSIQ